MLRLPKKGVVRNEQDETTLLANLAVQRDAGAFFDKYDRSEMQELLSTATVSWLATKEDPHWSLDVPSGLISQLKSIGFSRVILLTPVDPDAPLDFREVHQIIREVTVGIFSLNQIPSISLEPNFDQSTSCQLPPAYLDTLVGQILIGVDYMLKALWHGIYMPKEKRVRFSELWRSIMDIGPNGRPQTDRDIFAEFCTAGLADLSDDPDFKGIYDEDMNSDPTYDPDSPEEKGLFMRFVEHVLLQLAFSTTRLEQHENVFVFEAAYWLGDAVRCTEEQLGMGTYQRLQQRLTLHRKLVQKHLERKGETKRHMGYLKLIAFIIPLFLGLKKKMKVPNLSHLLPPFSDDKVKTERELPPFILGRDFRCRHFEYLENEYFHMHGGIQFDISTASIEEAYDDIQNCASCMLLESDSSYRAHYPIPIMEFHGRSYYVIGIELETFYQQLFKTQWWGAISEIMNTLRPKRLPLSDIQLHEQFKKKFGFKKAIKCKSLPYGMKSAAERGLTAIFYTFCRKTSTSSLNVIDELGYAILHHAALHNRVPIICQLANVHLNINQRRYILSNQDLTKPHNKSERNGVTPLHLAAQCGSLEALNCLLVLRADMGLPERRGWLPIHYAAFYDNICCIIVLCRKEPQLLEAETVAEDQCTPLLLTVMSGALDTFQYLFSLGANWKKTDQKGRNVIHLSVLNFHPEVVKHLIELDIPELPVWKTLVEMLNSENSKQRLMAVKSLEVICLAEAQYWKYILDAGTIPALVQLLGGPRLKLKLLAAGVLSNLSPHGLVGQALVDNGGVALLVNLLCSDQPELQARCAVILYDIAHCQSIDQSNGIPNLIHLLKSNMKDLLVNVMNCIRVVCVGKPAIQKAVRDHGGLPFFVGFLHSESDVLAATSAAAVAEIARGNTELQDAMAMEDALGPLVALFRGRPTSVQVKGAMAVEALADHNTVIQKCFLERSLTKCLLKLLKAFELTVKEQGAAALWALAGQTLKQQKFMAEQIGYNVIIDMLLAPSERMQYVGGEAVIALCKDSRLHQNQICAGNGIAPLVRLLRSAKIAVGTLLSVIRAVGTMCIGVAHSSNALSQQFVVEEKAFPVLIHLLRTHPSSQIQVEVAYSLACIVLKNSDLQEELQLKEDGGAGCEPIPPPLPGFQDIRLRAGYAVSLFAFNNCLQQFLILESGTITISIFEPFLTSDIETEKAMAAFQIVVLAKVIVDVEQIHVTARGVTLLTTLLNSESPATLALTGNLIASLAHTRAGIPEAFTALGAVHHLCSHLYSKKEEVRIACSCALGYLTFNATARRQLLQECHNKPKQFTRLTKNLSRDAIINPEFIQDFNRQKRVGLPALSLEINGGPPSVFHPVRGRRRTRKAGTKIEPKDSLVVLPPTSHVVGRLRAKSRQLFRHPFSFGRTPSSDIIKVSRPRTVNLNNLLLRKPKARGSKIPEATGGS
uniref:Ankyrin and armadillo repeat containing n=1 Tax=Ornithorhynchus anatinus TaxID=9258 RepID=F6W6A6_ORNAN